MTMGISYIHSPSLILLILASCGSRNGATTMVFPSPTVQKPVVECRFNVDMRYPRSVRPMTGDKGIADILAAPARWNNSDVEIDGVMRKGVRVCPLGNNIPDSACIGVDLRQLAQTSVDDADRACSNKHVHVVGVFQDRRAIQAAGSSTVMIGPAISAIWMWAAGPNDDYQ